MVYESNTNTRRENTRQCRVVSNRKGVRWMNLNENLAVTVGGGFFGGILIGYALKKIFKIVTVIAGFFLAALAYLRSQQIASLNWDKLQAISENTLTTLAMQKSLDLMAMVMSLQN